MKKIILLLIVFCNTFMLQSSPLIRKHRRSTRTDTALIDAEAINGKILFESNIPLDSSLFELTDTSGNIVWIGNLSIDKDGEYYIDITTLPKGTYSADLTIYNAEYCGNIAI